VKVCALLCLTLTLSGCGAKLDPFLYTRDRTDAYALPANGPDAYSTVTPDRLELLPPIPVGDGDQLGAVYIRGSESPPRGHALFFRGKGGHLDHQLEHAKRVANMGYDTLAFDYRGWGTSTDLTPTRETLTEDARAALAYLVARVGGDERILYYAHSLGTAIATELSVQSPPRALVLEAPFASIQDFVQDNSQMDLSWEFLANDGWNTAERIKEVNASLLLFHGLEDDGVRPEFGIKIFENAMNPEGKNRLELVEGGAHSVAPALGDAHRTITNAFVDQFIPVP